MRADMSNEIALNFERLIAVAALVGRFEGVNASDVFLHCALFFGTMIAIGAFEGFFHHSLLIAHE